MCVRMSPIKFVALLCFLISKGNTRSTLCHIVNWMEKANKKIVNILFAFVVGVVYFLFFFFVGRSSV